MLNDSEELPCVRGIWLRSQVSWKAIDEEADDVDATGWIMDGDDISICWFWLKSLCVEAGLSTGGDGLDLEVRVDETWRLRGGVDLLDALGDTDGITGGVYTSFPAT